MAQNTQVCGNCGTINALNSQFCSDCGYSLAGGPVYPTVQASSNIPTTVGTPANRRVTGALLAGNTLAGRYRIVGMIGRGGFGAVYKARDEHFPSKPLVAVKEMSDSQLSPGEKAKALQDFHNEADLLVQLKHPNLPNVSDVFEEGGKAYLVMEFIEGQTLANVQDAQNGPLDERLVMGWALQLCAVLHYLHTRPQPIIFRDMKPTNVMITPAGDIKLIDFGIARIFKAAVKKDTTLLGSQGYAPLEQYGRGQSDARSDIYALGATLYDLLTKELPADSPSRRVNPTLFIPPRQLNPKISPAVEAIILTAMAEDPPSRYQTAADMYRAIAATGLANTSNALLFASGPFSPLPPSSIPSGPTNYPPTPPSLASGPTNAWGQSQSSAGSAPGVAGYGIHSGGVPSYGSTPPASVPPPPPSAPTYPPSQPYPPSAPPRSRRAFLIGGAAIAGVAIVGGAVFLFSNRNNTTSSAAGGTLPLNFIYSTEKQVWIEQAITDFNNSNTQVGNKLVQIQGTGLGSVDAATKILNGNLQPAAWSPASDLELNKLINAWKQKHGSQDIVYTGGDLASQSLVFSPLVFAAWKDRSNLLKAKYGSIDWPGVHDALQLASWGDIPGGNPSWGPVKFGQTRPDSSNSGLLSIALLAYSFYNISRGLTVSQIQDSQFLSYFTDVENNVQKFGLSSGTYLEKEVIVQGPSAYDVVTTYENLVLTFQKEAQQRWSQPLIPSYPNLNIMSNHPFAIFTNASQDEQTAAKKFRDFLLGLPQQRKALLSGFRPANLDLSLHDPVSGNPFNDTSLGFKALDSLPTQVQAPSGEVTDELLKQWLSRYNTAPTALSISMGPYEG